MRTTLNRRGQITLPATLRRRLNLKPGDVLEFDPSAPFLKAIRTFDPHRMKAAIGCLNGAGEAIQATAFFRDTRGPVQLPRT